MASVFGGQFEAARAAGSLTFSGPTAVCVDDDALLVRRSRSGDVAAYGRLVEKYERRVMTLIARVISTGPGSYAGLQSDTEDLAQDVFVLAWRALPSFRGDSRFCTWLYRIAVNRALKERKRAKMRLALNWTSDEVAFEGMQRHPALSETAASRDPAVCVCESMRDAILRSAVDALSEKHRIVILLHYFEGCSCEEIAAIIGCSVGTVWSRLHYGCLKLRRSLTAADCDSIFER